MLHRRLVSAVILISVALGLLWLDLSIPLLGQRGVWTIPLLAGLALGTVWEFSVLLNLRWGISPRITLFHSLIALLVGLFPVWFSLVQQRPYPTDCPVGRMGWILVGVFVGIGLSGVHALRDFGQASESVSSESNPNKKETHAERTLLAWLLSSFVLTYVVGCMLMWHVIRMRAPMEGIYELIALVAAVKFADTGAYFTGKLFGKRKLIPSVSPGKTIEGLIGGATFSIVAAYIGFRVVLPRLGVEPGPFIWGPVVTGGLLTVVGVVGDLLESMVKRTVGAKDSGAVLPGLGGVWDVTDSLLPTAIVGYLILMARL